VNGERSNLTLMAQHAPALGYVVLVFVGASLNVKTGIPSGAFPLDKVMHALAFGGMVPLLLRSIRFELAEVRFWVQLLLASSVALLIGLLIEAYQLALPHRSAELLDVVADALGIALGVVLVLIQRKRTLQVEKPPSVP
jgi:VanZ family protein